MFSKVTNVEMTEKLEKLVSPIYLNNGRSSCLTIPKRLAIKYKMDEHCNVVITDTGTGFFIKKLELG